MNTVAKVSNRQIRQAVNHQASEVDAHRNVLRNLVNDELKTRGRVDALEAFRDMTFTQRLAWLLRGFRG